MSQKPIPHGKLFRKIPCMPILSNWVFNKVKFSKEISGLWVWHWSFISVREQVNQYKTAKEYEEYFCLQCIFSDFEKCLLSIFVYKKKYLHISKRHRLRISILKYPYTSNYY